MCAVPLTGCIKRACSLASHLRGPRQSPPGRPVVLPPTLPTPGPEAEAWSGRTPVVHSQSQWFCLLKRPALCLSLQPPRRRLQEQLHHQSSATPARGRPRRQDAEAQPDAGRELLLAPVLVRARLGCDTSAVVGRVLDAAVGAFGDRGAGWSGRGSSFRCALGSWLLVARGATWSLASGEGNRARERELVVGLPAL